MTQVQFTIASFTLKTMDNFRMFLILLGIFPHLIASSKSDLLPKFTVIKDGKSGDRSLTDEVPNILVTFPSGETDRLVLWNHHFNEEDRKLPKGSIPTNRTCIFLQDCLQLQTATILDKWQMTGKHAWQSLAVLGRKMLRSAFGRLCMTQTSLDTFGTNRGKQQSEAENIKVSHAKEK